MSRPTDRRPVLVPFLRRLWRDPHRLQLGTDPRRAVMIEFSDPAGVRVLDLLDGTRTEQALVSEAGRLGVSADDALTLVAELGRLGLVVDAPTLDPVALPVPTRRRLATEAAAIAVGGATPAEVLGRRWAARVRVSGAARLGVHIACVLANSGVGHLDPAVTGQAQLADAGPAGLLPTDAYRPRAVVAAEAIRRGAPEVRVQAIPPGAATVEVLVGFGAPVELVALAHERRRSAHLAVAVRDGTVVVGPFVLPGRTPCLNCIDLHRRDRDPAWPALAAQLTTTAEAADTVAVTTMLVGAAYAAREVTDHIDGDEPVTIGATVEIAGPGRESRRRWTAHPACGCLTGNARHTRSGPS
ncbi:hypothetical protein GCM10009682_10460 [Luedemannella flava]|uniref:Bacteriocin biosynthesis cyclodehydratase domain-containing protein n=1 Tax=Luedemannella flava TaxID=349316 RepID=A0ABN2LJ43_9ACTN